MCAGIRLSVAWSWASSDDCCSEAPTMVICHPGLAPLQTSKIYSPPWNLPHPISYEQLGRTSFPSKEDSMPRPCFWATAVLVLVVGLAGSPGAPLRAQTAVGDSAEFAAWRQVQKEDIDGLRKKFMALAKAVPTEKLTWRPMEGTRSFREVFAHIAAEGNTETAIFGRPLPPGSLPD